MTEWSLYVFIEETEGKMVIKFKMFFVSRKPACYLRFPSTLLSQCIYVLHILSQSLNCNSLQIHSKMYFKCTFLKCKMYFKSRVWEFFGCLVLERVNTVLLNGWNDKSKYRSDLGNWSLSHVSLSWKDASWK